MRTPGTTDRSLSSWCRVMRGSARPYLHQYVQRHGARVSYDREGRAIWQKKHRGRLAANVPDDATVARSRVSPVSVAAP